MVWHACQLCGQYRKILSSLLRPHLPSSWSTIMLISAPGKRSASFSFMRSLSRATTSLTVPLRRMRWCRCLNRDTQIRRTSLALSVSRPAAYAVIKSALKLGDWRRWRELTADHQRAVQINQRSESEIEQSCTSKRRVSATVRSQGSSAWTKRPCGSVFIFSDGRHVRNLRLLSLQNPASLPSLTPMLQDHPRRTSRVAWRKNGKDIQCRIGAGDAEP